jgi:outer membrane protein OmpA-like peptidoglycan-associated protein
MLPAALLVLSGCATRGWVQDQMGQQKTQVDQRIVTVETKVDEEAKRIGAVEARVTDQGQTVQGMGTRMGTFETSLGNTATAAKGAGERADGAMARANEVDNRLSRLWKNRDARNLVETVEVRFAFAKADLGDAAQTALVGLAREMKANPRLALELEGYTDPSGSLHFNLALSQRRVEAVRRFLVQQGIDQRRIQGIALGPANGKLPADQKRLVIAKLSEPVE